MHGCNCIAIGIALLMWSVITVQVVNSILPVDA